MNDIKCYDLRGCLRRRYQKNLQNPEEGQFPHGEVNYPDEFEKIEKHLNEVVHPEIVKSAAAQGDGLLTDHGSEHVAMVIQRASLLVGNGASRLTGYEVFILLLAIHFHDAGNIFGRDEHERKISKIVHSCALLDSVDGLDEVVKRWIIRIAATHGGKTEESSKDTISQLPLETDVRGVKIRPALLAAILRFADEIADDNTRAAKFLDKMGVIPAQNQIYHKFSASLQPVSVSERELYFQFYLTKADVICSYGKNDKTQLLYDEILLRMKKCYCELIYCAKYADGILSKIMTIRAEVYVYENKEDVREVFKESLSLKVGGYPDYESGQKFEDLPGEQPKCLTGLALQEKMNEQLSKKITYKEKLTKETKKCQIWQGRTRLQLLVQKVCRLKM